MTDFNFSIVSQSIIDKMYSDINHYEMCESQNEKEIFFSLMVNALNTMWKEKGKPNRLYSLNNKNDAIDFLKYNSLFALIDIVNNYKNSEVSPYFDNVVSVFQYQYSTLSALLKEYANELLVEVIKYPNKVGYSELYSFYVTQTLEVFFPKE